MRLVWLLALFLALPIRFHAAPSPRIADVPASAFRNANGSPRFADSAAYLFLRRRVAPRLERWAGDARLRIDPALVLATLIKESAGDTLAVSSAGALGVAQLTTEADSDLRIMTTSDRFAWMRGEVARWPRSPVLRRGPLTRARLDSLVAAGALSSRTEFLLDPRASARAAVLWMRVLEEKWTTDEWPGAYGSEARRTLNGGRPLTESQLLDLVVVSYNRGYLQVHALVRRYGVQWTSHLAELPGGAAEAADYLERIRAYTEILER